MAAFPIKIKTSSTAKNLTLAPPVSELLFVFVLFIIDRIL
jgi:hypothetical protein